MTKSIPATPAGTVKFPEPTAVKRTTVWLPEIVVVCAATQGSTAPQISSANPAEPRQGRRDFLAPAQDGHWVLDEEEGMRRAE